MVWSILCVFVRVLRVLCVSHLRVLVRYVSRRPEFVHCGVRVEGAHGPSGVCFRAAPTAGTVAAHHDLCESLRHRACVA